MKKSALFLLIGLSVGTAGTHLVGRLGVELAPSLETRTDDAGGAATAAVQRLVQDDALAALEQAVDLGVTGPARDGVVAAAADTNLEAVGRLLAQIRPASRAEAFAASLLAALGADSDALDYVVRAMSDSEQDAARLRVRLVAALVESDPQAAAALAASLRDPFERERAESRVAVAWAAVDPLAAVEHFEAIDDPARRGDRLQETFMAWSLTDPFAALAQYERLRSGGMKAGVADFAAAELLARRDPESLLNMASTSPVSLGLLPLGAADSAIHLALSELAERDPQAALTYADAYGSNAERQNRLSAVAEGWARRDLDAALEWARGQGMAAASLEGAIYGVIAEADPLRALDLAVEMEGSGAARGQAVQNVMVRALSADSGAAQRLAEAALAISQAALRQSALEGVIRRWEVEAPESAMQWVVDNADRVPEEAFRLVLSSFRLPALPRPSGSALAPGIAASYTHRVPVAIRPDWIATVGYAYARENPRASIAWLENFRGEAGYANGVASVAAGLAETDPREAIDLVDRAQLTPTSAATIQESIAQTWAQQEPRAAMSWARTLTDARARESAERQIVRAWAAGEPEAARNWVLTMPEGDGRDAALGSLLTAGLYDEAVMNAFGSDSARSRELMRYLPMLASEDSATARELVDRYISDRTLRETADRMMMVAGRAQSSFVMTEGGGLLRLPRVDEPQ